MDLFAKFGFDDTLETKGVWCDLGDGSCLIARFGNEKHQQTMVELRTAYKKELEADTPESQKLSRDLLIRTLVNTIVLDWKGMSYGGKELPYTPENATKVLQHREFREWVIGQALNADHYRATVLEEDLGNSELPSNGSSPGEETSTSSLTSNEKQA